MRAMRIPLALPFATACLAGISLWGKDATAERALRTAAAAPACVVELVAVRAHGEEEGVVRIKAGGRELALERADWPVERLRVYPHDSKSVLLALVYVEGSQHEPRGSGTLWRVPCAADGAPRKLASGTDTDFGHSALGPDGRALYFTGKDGIFAMNLRTRKSRRLTRATSPLCKQHSVPARDVVESFAADGTLSFDRGCGFEWGWHARAMRLRAIDSPRPIVEPLPRLPLAAVAVDASGGIWLSDGTCADPSTFNRLLYSTDRGQHWRSVAVPRDPKIPAAGQPIRQVITDGKDGKALLVFTRSCVEGGQHVEPAWVYVSEDGGSTFRAIGAPPGIPSASAAAPASETDPFYAIAARDSLSDLVLFGQSTTVTGKALACWESRDRGRTWKALYPVNIPFEQLPAPQPWATFADWKVVIDGNGLYLSVTGRPGRTRIYPRR